VTLQQFALAALVIPALATRTSETLSVPTVTKEAHQ